MGPDTPCTLIRVYSNYIIIVYSGIHTGWDHNKHITNITFIPKELRTLILQFDFPTLFCFLISTVKAQLMVPKHIKTKVNVNKSSYRNEREL